MHVVKKWLTLSFQPSLGNILQNQCWSTPVKLVLLYLTSRKMSQVKSKRSPSHFILSLQAILQNRDFSNIIQWNQLEGILHIKNPEALVNTVFAGHFKHQSLKSFVRQLNLYGFRKVVRKKQTLIFKNEEFTKQNFDEGKFIKRTVQKKKVAKMQTDYKNKVVTKSKFNNQNQIQYQSTTVNNCDNKPKLPYLPSPKPKVQSTCHLEQIHNQKFQVSKLNSLESFEILGNYYDYHAAGRLKSFEIFEEEIGYQQKSASIFENQ